MKDRYLPQKAGVCSKSQICAVKGEFVCLESKYVL